MFPRTPLHEVSHKIQTRLNKNYIAPSRIVVIIIIVIIIINNNDIYVMSQLFLSSIYYKIHVCYFLATF